MTSAVLLVILSVAKPESTCNCAVKAAALVSSVKVMLLEAVTLPAVSVWRTQTVFKPSCGVKLLTHLLP